MPDGSLITSSVQPYLTAGKDLAILVAAGFGAYWFFYTRQHKRRVSFQVEATALPALPSGECRAVELRFLLDNKGERQQYVNRIVYVLDIPADPTGVVDADAVAQTSAIDWRFVMCRMLQPPAAEDAPRVRGGSQQMLSDCLAIPRNTHIVRVTARLERFCEGESHETVKQLPYPARATIRRHFTLNG